MSYGEPIALRGQMELEQVAPATAVESRPQAEAEFIERLKRGDAAAFEKLVDERSGEIYGLLYRLTENSEEARDLTQETFLRRFRVSAAFAAKRTCEPGFTGSRLTRRATAGAGGAGGAAMSTVSLDATRRAVRSAVDRHAEPKLPRTRSRTRLAHEREVSIANGVAEVWVELIEKQ